MTARSERGRADLGDALLEGVPGEWSWSVDGSSVVVGTPRRAVDVDVLWPQTQRLGFNGVGDVTIEHAHSYTAQRHQPADDIFQSVRVHAPTDHSHCSTPRLFLSRIARQFTGGLSR